MAVALSLSTHIKALAVAALILTPLLLLSCSGDANVHRKRVFFRMDTMTEATISVPRSFNPNPIWNAIDSLLGQSEKRFSVTGELSEIKTLNERTSSALAVSKELGEMLTAGIEYGDTLNGSFDITVLPLKELWGFCEQCADDAPLPDSASIASALRSVNYKNVRVGVAGDSVFFGSPETRLDAGGIAKGFVLRRLYALMKGRGIDNFLIAAGGDIVASGRKQDGAPWRVGVRHPRSPSELIAAISLDSGALVTSGDYERARVVGGLRYHHIFDPFTGSPCGRNQSLTIRAPDPVRADILSTGLFCMEAGAVLEFVNAREGLECLVVDSAGNVYHSDGF
jgi:thiamine biosynthesis lipoprotein